MSESEIGNETIRPSSPPIALRISSVITVVGTCSSFPLGIRVRRADPGEVPCGQQQGAAGDVRRVSNVVLRQRGWPPHLPRSVLTALALAASPARPGRR